MYGNDETNSVFENHSMFNRYNVIFGMRPSELTTQPSVYITELKLKKALASLDHIEIENIAGRELYPYGVKLKRESIIKKLDKLHDWQLFYALEILMTEGSYDAVKYVVKCKRSDINPNLKNEPAK